MALEKNGHSSRQAKKKAEILAAGTDIFLKEGYGRASMDQVHACIGGSKRTLYNHFPSKEALFEAIVKSVSDRALKALTPPLKETPLKDALVRMGTDYLGVLLSPDGLSLYRAMVSEAPHFSNLSAAFFHKGPSRASHHLAEFFEDQNRQKALKVGDPQAAAEHFLGAIRGDIHLAAVLSARSVSQAELEKNVSQVTDLFLKTFR